MKKFAVLILHLTCFYLAGISLNYAAVPLDKGSKINISQKDVAPALNLNALLFALGNNIDTQFDTLQVECCEDTLMQVQFTIKNNLGNSVRITSLVVDRVNGIPTSIPVSNISPGLPIVIAGFSSQSFTATIPCQNNAQTIRFLYYAEDAFDNVITETEVGIATLECPCDPCNDLGVSVVNDGLSLVSGSSDEITLDYVLSGLNPNEVKRVTIELVYFNIEQLDDPDCAKCAANPQWGNFIPPATLHSGFDPPVLNGTNFGRLWTWLSTVQKDCDQEENLLATFETEPNEEPVETPFDEFDLPAEHWLSYSNNHSLTIAVPPGNSLECCGDKISVCIRYTFWDFCCEACEEIRCYDITRP